MLILPIFSALHSTKCCFLNFYRKMSSYRQTYKLDPLQRYILSTSWLLSVYELTFWVSTSWFFRVYELTFRVYELTYFFVYEYDILSTSRSVYESVCLRVDHNPIKRRNEPEGVYIACFILLKPKLKLVMSPSRTYCLFYIITQGESM